MAIAVVDRPGGETISPGPILNRILEDASHTRRRIGLLEVTLPPRTGGPLSEATATCSLWEEKLTGLRRMLKNAIYERNFF